MDKNTIKLVFLVGVFLVLFLSRAEGARPSRRFNEESEDWSFIGFPDIDPSGEIPATRHHIDSLNRMSEYVQNNFPDVIDEEDPEGVVDPDAPVRKKRSVGRRVFPRWFTLSCIKNFCGFYNCNTFTHTEGRRICKACRFAMCHARGASPFGNPKSLCPACHA